MRYQPILEKSVEHWNQWRIDHPTLLPDFSGADLSRHYLLDANLSGVNLRGADLSRACLIGADLSWADLSYASLQGAYLSQANLLSARLSGANLLDASFEGTNLSYADLSNTQINDVDLVRAQYTGTVCFIHPEVSTSKPLWENGQYWYFEFQDEFDYNQLRQSFMHFETPQFSRQGVSLS